MAIQDAMGWWDYHLHASRFRKRKNSRNAFEIGIPVDEFADWVVHPGWEIPITDFFDAVGVRGEYDPKQFSPENVKFDKPGWQWRKAFLEE